MCGQVVDLNEMTDLFSPAFFSFCSLFSLIPAWLPLVVHLDKPGPPIMDVLQPETYLFRISIWHERDFFITILLGPEYKERSSGSGVEYVKSERTVRIHAAS
jgi:hypothetical protein